MIPFSYNLSEVGGKARGLLRGKALGLPVPPFFLLIPHSHPLDLETIRKTLGEGPFYVRSSFLGEDEEGQSFAGLGRTLGHVPLKELPRAVEEVWRSWETVHARAYREGKGVSGKPRGAVIIQKEVIPYYSGVFFTRSPQAVGAFFRLEAVRGYGDALVQGRVKPLVVEGHERKRVYLSPPPSPLLKKIMRKLLAMVPRFREVVSGEADVEWVYDHNGKLWILQLRPLLPQPPLLSRSLAEEFWSGKVSPLMFSAVGSLIEEAMLKRPFSLFTPIPERMLHWKSGYIYLDLRPLLRALALIPPWAVTPEVLKHFPPPVRRRYEEEKNAYHPLFTLDLLRVFLRFIQAKAPWFPLLQPLLLQRFLHHPLLTTPPSSQKEELCQEIETLRAELKKLLDLVVWGMVYSYLLTPLLHRGLGNGKGLRLLYRDLPFDPVHAFLKDLRRFSRKVSYALEEPNLEGFLKRLAPQDKEEFFALQKRWAHRAEERDLRSPRLGENPLFLWELLRLTGSEEEQEDPHPWWRSLFQGNGEDLSPFTLIRGGVLLPLAWVTRLYLGFREGMRDAADRYLYALRLRFLRLASLEGEEHPWERAFNGKGFVPFDQEEEEEELPTFYLGNQPLKEEVLEENPGSSFRGVPISQGIGEGKGVFLSSTHDLHRFSPGDVLLSPYLDPTFAVALRRAAAGIFSAGGMLSHGAILAREFGIPVVSGIPLPSLKAWDGKFLRVDGMRGTVTLLSHEEQRVSRS